MHGRHDVEDEAPDEVENRPTSHKTHADDNEAPTVPEYVPAAQPTQ